MRTIELSGRTGANTVIHFARIRPFKNICKVTGVEELCNIEVEYIPDEKVIDIVDYRAFFNRTFNELIENIAGVVWDEIWTSASPKWLKVTAYLEGNPHLTDWSCTVEGGER